VESGYDLAQLSLFSRTLFYVRENDPKDVAPRARELLVGALEAVASQDREVLVERDPQNPPGWVTVTVNERPCRLNIERVDAPWSLRTELQQAMRFVQGNLGPASATDPAQRLMRIELAATNGMLSALDHRSELLDPETYQLARAHLPKRSNPTRADVGAVQGGEPVSPVLRRSGPGSTVGYLRLSAFTPGVSGDVEHGLAGFEAARTKGLVLDLRDNQGGILEEAVKVADAFIRSGTLGSIVTKQERQELVAHDDGHEPSGALVVLVNRRTAAGSELVAAAIKNLGRGVILGEPTAGAGAIRVVFELPKPRPRRSPTEVADGTKPPASQPVPGDEPFGLFLMTGRLLAAGGGEIEGAGVKPDVQPACPGGEQTRPHQDCLLQLAQDLVLQAHDPQRATLLSTARTLPAP
jgi:hypothetical protein